MAKLFYTLEEAAARLRKTPDEVRQMVAAGQLQEFRDRDRLVFKVDQVDLLAGGGDESGVIPLAESGELSALNLASDSGSGMGLEAPKEQTGISIFEADQTEEADPSAVTQITETAVPEVSLEPAGEGSGMLDLTREADDTSLGRDLLAEGSDTVAATTGGETPALFESAPGETEPAAAVPALLTAEPYDGLWSGLAGGAALGVVLVAAFTLALTLFGLTQSQSLAAAVAPAFWTWVASAAGAVVLLAIIGALVGRRA